MFTKLKRLFGDGFEHQLPDLEAMLPGEVAGRPMTKWSVRGADYFAGTPITPDELEALKSDLASEGMGIDDIGMAVAGRSDVAADPPYFVHAFRWRTVPADMLPPHVGVTHPDAGSWTPIVFGGREVLVGTDAMVEQTQHLRGRPYLYNLGDVRFVVTTEDEAWAADAVAGLRPDPLVERAPMYLTLPPGWRPGLAPSATDEAVVSVRGDPDCLAVAHDGSMAGQAYVPSLKILFQGAGDEIDIAGFLDRQERVFRDASEPELTAAIRSVTRVTLPSGEALRVVLVTDDPEPLGSIAQVQFYIPTQAGPFGLWFACAASDLPTYEATFDQMAQTFRPTAGAQRQMS